MGQNGRKPCPECGYRDTEKAGRYRYQCHSCGHEWTDDEERERDRRRRKRRKERKRRRRCY